MGSHAKLNRALLLFLIIPFSLVSVIGQMVPISEVKTHPPSGASDSRSSDQRRASGTKTAAPHTEGGSHPFDQAKMDAHTKIAAAHMKEREDEYYESQVSSFPTVETDKEGRKIIRKDKAPDLQNPVKHSSDQQLLKFLLDQYVQISTSSTSQVDLDLQIEILTNIQHFAHKYENGRDLFQATDALETILLPGLNSTYYEIRKSICSIFAVAGQNNLAVQELAMKHGVLRQLIHILSTDAMVRPKALYALSSLLRNYPEGQLKFMQDGGVQILVSTAFLSETRQKSVTLLIDLIKEQKYSASAADNQSYEDTETSESAAAAASDHNLIISSLRQSEWCELLTDNIRTLHGFSQDDQMLILDAIRSSLDLNICTVDSMVKYRQEFEDLLNKYEESLRESGIAKQQQQVDVDDFMINIEIDEFKNGIDLLKRIMSRMSKNQEANPADHDEL